MVFTGVGVTIELEGIGGNLYVNMVLFASIEAVMSVITGSLITKYDVLFLKKASYLLCGLLLAVFFFAPRDIHQLPPREMLIYIIPVILNKAFYEIAWSLTVIFIPKIIEVSYIPLVLSLVMFLARIPVSLIPYINYFFFMINIHPFVFYCLLWLFSVYTFRFYQTEAYSNIEPIPSKKISGSKPFVSSVAKGKTKSSESSLIFYKENTEKTVEQEMTNFVEIRKPFLPKISQMALGKDDE
jgi:hypothetical protein